MAPGACRQGPLHRIGHATGPPQAATRTPAAGHAAARFSRRSSTALHAVRPARRAPWARGGTCRAAGRERELAAATDTLHRGRGCLLVGPPGIGRTATAT